GGSVKVLSPDRKLGLGLLFECLTQPKFPAMEFERQKIRLLNTIVEEQSQPENRAQQTFSELVYGKHPYGRPSNGTEKTVKPLTREDCLAFHRRVFVPNNTVLAIVGDFDSKDVVEEVKKLTAGWKKQTLEETKPPAVAMPQKPVEKIITMPDAAQLQFFL